MLSRVREWLFDRFLLPGSFLEETGRKRRGSRSDAGYAIVLAFGRNQYPDNNFFQRLRGEITTKDIADWHRKFGSNDTFERISHWWRKFDPGQPNEMLAELCFQKFEDMSIPILFQWETAFSLWDEHRDWYDRNQENLVVIWPDEEGNLTTHSFLLRVREIARMRGWYNPFIFVHPEHVQRAYFLAKRIYPYETVRATDLSPSPEWFDRRSVQWWTRGSIWWLACEMLARVHHRLHGWM